MQKVLTLILASITALIVVVPLNPVLKNPSCFLQSTNTGEMQGDEFFSYIPRSAAYAKGFWGGGDAGLKEHAGEYFNTFEKIPPLVTGFLLAITKDTDLVYLFSLFLGIFSSYILCFSLLRSLKISFGNAHFFIIFVLLFSEISQVYSFLSLVPGLNHIASYSSYTRRFYQILVSQPLWFATLLIGIQSFKKKTVFSYTLFGLSAGLLAYVYVYYWLVTGTCLVLFAVVLALRTKSFSKSIAMFLGFTSVSIPFLLAYAQQDNPVGISLSQDFKAASIHTIYSHWYLGNQLSLVRATIIMVSTLIFVGIHKKISKQHWHSYQNILIVLVTLLASEMSFNLNIITGTTVQPYHIGNYISFPIFLVLCLVVFQHIIHERLQKISIFMSITLLLLVSLVSSDKIKLTQSKTALCQSSFAETMEFLNSLPEHQVFLAEPKTDNHLLSYTPHFTYIPYSYISMIEYEEAMNRLAWSFYILGYDSESIRNSLETMSGIPYNLLYKLTIYTFSYSKIYPPPPYYPSLKDRDLSYQAVYLVPEEFIASFLERFESIVQNKPPYELDYIVTSAGDFVGPAGIRVNTKEAFKSGNYKLLQVTNSQ
jgi:hypothetical protein